MKKVGVKFNKGFSLIEVLIVVFIMSIAFVSFYTVSTVGTKYIIESKNRLAATAFANEKMEIIRNLAYADVGIQGGSPSGNIPEDEDVTANGHAFHVRTIIQYVDDPMDGVFPVDPIPNDYKITKIIVSWTDSNGQTQEVDSESRFVPPGLETTAGGAPLAINVIGSDGITGVSQANVHIVNSTVTPGIDFNIQTDDDGHIMMPSMPVSSGGYQFTITKDGYETVATVDPASVSYTPVYRNQDVDPNTLNSYTYIEDKLSNLTVKSLDYQSNPVGGISYSIKGGKILDTTGNVVDMDTTGTTDGTTGEKKYSNISPGNYTILTTGNSQYTFIDYDPSISPDILAPDSDLAYTLRMADKNVNALFLEIKDASASNAPVAGAKVTLTDAINTVIFTDKLSSTRGVVFYPDVATPLASGIYTLTIDADGYNLDTESISIDKLTHKEVDLTKS
jgi:prepilin-type N-terminal cleavage/methylation domain-containing protein